MFSSLKVRNFRLYWFGMLLSLVGTWIQTVAQSWLVFQLTNSAFLLGLVGFLGLFPVFLFSLFGGVAADRVNKRKILLFTQNAFMVLAFILAIMTQLKIITPLQIMIIALLNGVVMAFDAPARQSVVVELAGKQHLLNAIALNSAAFNSARIIGPALAGLLIAGVGMSGCFYINGISFLAVIFALLLIKHPGAVKRAEKTAVFKDLTEGLVFIKNNKTILILIVMVAITSLFGLSYVILMPVFASDVLKVQAKGFGILMSSAGTGALLAALMLARLGDVKQKGKSIIISSLVFSIALILFSLSRIFSVSIIFLVLIGWSSVTSVSLINNSLQVLVPDEYRGRIMSAFMFTFGGFVPFGNLLAGSISQAFGVNTAIMFSGLILLVCFIMISVFFPDIKKI